MIGTFSPGTIWQSGVPLENGIEESREGNQEGGDQDHVKEDIIGVGHLLKIWISCYQRNSKDIMWSQSTHLESRFRVTTSSRQTMGRP